MDERQYFNMTQAAQFLGYATRTFFNYVKMYRIPRVGPKQNKFDRRDLEQFMENPQVFLPTPRHNKARYSFKPVSL